MRTASRATADVAAHPAAGIESEPMDDLDRLLEEIADLNALVDVDVSAYPELAHHQRIPAARTLVREALDLVVRARQKADRPVFAERAAEAVRLARQAVDEARPALAWARLRARLAR
jgi:hypothetical protein